MAVGSYYVKGWCAGGRLWWSSGLQSEGLDRGGRRSLPPAPASSVSVVVVRLEVGVDVGSRLVEDGVGVTTSDDVLRCLGEGRGQERVARRRGTKLGERRRRVEEEALLAARLPSRRQLGRLVRCRDVA